MKEPERETDRKERGPMEGDRRKEAKRTGVWRWNETSGGIERKDPERYGHAENRGKATERDRG